MATRAATHQLGAKMLEKLLRATTEFEPAVPCGCGQRARFHQLRPKQILTVLGPITMQRPYYLCRIAIKGRVRATRNWMWRVQNTRPLCVA